MSLTSANAKLKSGGRSPTSRADLAHYEDYVSRHVAILQQAGEDSDLLEAARAVLIAELRNKALVKGAVTLSSGLQAEYYVDAKRAVLSHAAFFSVGLLVGHQARSRGATAVGGLTIGADPVACGTLAAVPDLKAFLVRKEKKRHGLQKWIEGPLLEEGERCLIVDDVVTTGTSVLDAVARVHEEGLQVAAVVSVLDRKAGGAKAIEDAAKAPYIALTTIDDVYPDRPDR